MVLFKSCPKCSTGDLLKTEDMFGEYLACVQCGFVKDISSVQKEAPAPVDEPTSTVPDAQRWSA